MYSRIWQLCVAITLCSVFSQSAISDDHGEARFDRTTLVVRDMEASVRFWRDVMDFELVMEPRVLPPTENLYLGWSIDATVTFARFVSPDGAGVGLLEIQQENFASLDIESHATGYGGVILVMVAKNIDGIYERAKDAGAVFKPLGLSPTGRSKQMYLKSPSGHVLELYELLKSE